MVDSRTGCTVSHWWHAPVLSASSAAGSRRLSLLALSTSLCYGGLCFPSLALPSTRKPCGRELESQPLLLVALRLASCPLPCLLLPHKLYPSASEALCADTARSLALEGRVLVTGMIRDREWERGKGWVILAPQFLVHNVLGGVLASRAGSKAKTRGDGIVSAADVCEAVIG